MLGNLKQQSIETIETPKALKLSSKNTKATEDYHVLSRFIN